MRIIKTFLKNVNGKGEIAYFVHVPKTAGLAIREKISEKKLNIKILSHTPIEQAHLCSTKKSFGFTRNPWDRCVSAFFYLNKGGRKTKFDMLMHKNHIEGYKGNFKRFVIQEIRTKRLLNKLHFREQHLFLCNSNGKTIVDFVGKYEYLQTHFEEILRELGEKHPPGILKQTNISFHQGYKSYYDEETKEIIKEIYQKDIERFGYTFEGPISKELLFT